MGIPAKIEIRIDSLDNIRSLYNCIKVYRAEIQEESPYYDDYQSWYGYYASNRDALEGLDWYEITAEEESSAEIFRPSISDFYFMEDKSLLFTIDGLSNVSIAFNRYSYTFNQMLKILNDRLGSFCTVLVDSDPEGIIIRSLSSGLTSSLEIGGSASEDFGYESGHIETGKSVRIPITNHHRFYNLTDYNSSRQYIYRYAFYNRLTRSESDAILANPFSYPVVNPDLLSKCNVKIIDSSGNGRSGIKISFYPSSIISGGSLVSSNPKVVETDAFGNTSAFLLRGNTYKFSVEGTSIFKEFSVPILEDEFNLFDLVSEVDDQFTVQVPDTKDYVHRRS